MDFNSLEVATTSVFLHLKHPGTNDLLWDREPSTDMDGNIEDPGEPVGVWIFSTDSEPYAKRKRELLTMRIDNAANRNSKKPSAADIEREELLTIAACIDRFQNVSLDGVGVDGDRSRFISTLKRLNWMKEQVDRGMADRGLFLKASSKT